MAATKEQVIAFMTTEFPQSGCVVEEVSNHGAKVSRSIGTNDLRPGGTVAGPVLMGTADVALYAAILGRLGIVPLAVTTSLNINFLRKPSANARVIADCTLLKVGRALVIGEISLYSEGSTDLVAHAVGTYSIPPAKDSNTG